jgi:vacuolar-type H+-ATPase subunit I/STV1
MTLGGVLKAANIGVAIARGRAKAVIRNAIKQAVFASIVLGLLVLAFGFGLGCFAVWLSHEIGTVPALGYIALGFLVIAIIVYVIWRVSSQRPAPARRRSPIADAFDERKAGQEPPPGSALGSLAVVALVGYLMGRQIFRK